MFNYRIVSTLVKNEITAAIMVSNLNINLQVMFVDENARTAAALPQSNTLLEQIEQIEQYY